MLEESAVAGLQDTGREADGTPRVAIIRQWPKCVEVPWARFLLGDFAGEVIEDPDRTVVRPHSVVLCDHLDLLTPEFLDEVRRLGTVGLFHISQQWYRDPLEAYRAFAFVWRTHHYTALTGLPVRQFPLPSAAMAEVAAEPRPEAHRPLTERRYPWSFAGQVKTTRVAMMRAFRQIDGGYEHLTGMYDDLTTPRLDAASYGKVLADSMFVPCSMGNVHLESFRAYEALEMGAIPIVEDRPWLDYYGNLLGDHPLPAVRSWSEAPRLVERLLADEARLLALQQELVAWWTAKKRELTEVAQADVAATFSDPTPVPPLAGAALPGRWRGRWEMLRHHNTAALRQRARLTTKRLVEHRSVRRSPG